MHIMEKYQNFYYVVFLYMLLITLNSLRNNSLKKQKNIQTGCVLKSQKLVLCNFITQTTVFFIKHEMWC